MPLAFAACKEARERELLTLNAQDLARHLGAKPVGLKRIVMRLGGWL